MTPTDQIRRNIEMYCSTRAKGGSLDLVHLQVGNQHYSTEFINKCLDELDRMPLRAAAGDQPSNLEKLAYDLLKVGTFVEANNI